MAELAVFKGLKKKRIESIFKIIVRRSSGDKKQYQRGIEFPDYPIHNDVTLRNTKEIANIFNNFPVNENIFHFKPISSCSYF